MGSQLHHGYGEWRVMEREGCNGSNRIECREGEREGKDKREIEIRVSLKLSE